MNGPRNPTRVVVINDRSIAHGGATAVALLSARLLRQRGIPVTFVSGDAGLNPELKDLGIAVHALGDAALLEARASTSFRRGLFNNQARLHIENWIRQHDDPNTVYHVHTWNQILSPSIFFALRSVRERLFVAAHDYFLACPNGAYSNFKTSSVCNLTPLSFACLATNCDRRSYTHKMWRVARKVIQDRALSYGDAGPQVLTIHAAMQPRLTRGGVPPKAMSTLPNPIQPWSKTRIPAEKNEQFVFVGRLSYEKGPDLVAQAAREAGVPLLMIGDGILAETLREKYPEVRFVGRQPMGVIAELVREARALLMPSRLPEPFGLVACEALWSGLPVILSDQALLSTDIATREAGIACDVKNSEAFGNAMKLLANDDTLTEKMSYNAFNATADLGHQTDDWIDAVLTAYRSALSPYPPFQDGIGRDRPLRSD